MKSIRTITFYTANLPLTTKEAVELEIKAQGIKGLLEHTKWVDYLVFAVQDIEGRVVEIFKEGQKYMKRDNYNQKHDWEFPEEDEICQFIDSVLKAV